MEDRFCRMLNIVSELLMNRVNSRRDAEKVFERFVFFFSNFEFMVEENEIFDVLGGVGE